MREIGGYFGMEENHGTEYHKGAIALNSGRNALAYLVEAAGYKKVYIPDFSCSSIEIGISKGGACVEKYKIKENLRPDCEGSISKDEAILLINYYGQISNNEIKTYKKNWRNIIVDNTQAFFQAPINDTDTIYSCRKFFGVSDGAYLFTNKHLRGNLNQDVSANRMIFVLGRYDESASKYYDISTRNNESFNDEEIMYMSRVTHNLLRGIDYDLCKHKRNINADYLHKNLGKLNSLDVQINEGMFMYPLYLPNADTDRLRKHLHKEKIYVPCLWPEAIIETERGFGKKLSSKIVPLPCDQRYGLDDMKYMIEIIIREVG